ncbi:MAG: hypothetical protein Q9168_007569 [Polycauliona sp. 1 TL-2023]
MSGMLSNNSTGCAPIRIRCLGGYQSSDEQLTRWRKGNDGSIGIFLHATDSSVDQEINGTQPDPTVSKTLPPDWAYLGCNTVSDEQHSNRSWEGDGLSLERCGEYCTGLSYFGTAIGSQ